MIIKVETQKGERAVLIAHHIVVVFKNHDGTSAVSLSNGEILDLTDQYNDLIQRLTHTLGRSSKGPLESKLVKDGVLSFVRPQFDGGRG